LLSPLAVDERERVTKQQRDELNRRQEDLNEQRRQLDEDRKMILSLDKKSDDVNNN